MRILRVIASARAEGGGPVAAMTASTMALAARGHTSEVVTFDAPYEPALRHASIPAHGLGPARGALFGRHLADWIAANAGRFDVVVIHGLWNAASVGGWRGARRAGLPHVVFVHGMLDPWFRQAYPLKHVLKQLYWLMGQGWALQAASAVLFTAEEERRRARGMFIGPGYRGEVVAYGSAPPPPASSGESATFATKVSALAGRPYLLFLSRIHLKKGVDLLLDAFIAQSERLVGLDLVIAGPDEAGLVPGLRAQAERAGLGGRVHFPGMLTGAAKWAAFRGATAFVLPSHQENFGLAVSEALSCGVPVLISDKVNIWREIEAAGAGLVETDERAGTERLLARFAALSTEHRATMGAAGRGLHAARFSIEGAAADLESVLETAIGGRR